MFSCNLYNLAWNCHSKRLESVDINMGKQELPLLKRANIMFWKRLAEFTSKEWLPQPGTLLCWSKGCAKLPENPLFYCSLVIKSLSILKIRNWYNSFMSHKMLAIILWRIYFLSDSYKCSWIHFFFLIVLLPIFLNSNIFQQQFNKFNIFIKSVFYHFINTSLVHVFPFLVEEKGHTL